MDVMSLFLRIAITTVTAVYPFAIYIGLQQGAPRLIAPILLALAAMHSYIATKGNTIAWLWAGMCLLVGTWTWLDGTALGLKFYPVFVSIGLFILFGWGLINPPNVIERFARLKHTNLSRRKQRYTKAVCIAWCGFFIVNGSISGYLAIYASNKAWALYTGLLSYIAMGIFFAIELAIRYLHDGKSDA